MQNLILDLFIISSKSISEMWKTDGYYLLEINGGNILEQLSFEAILGKKIYY